MAKIRIPRITWLLLTFLLLSPSALLAAETTVTVTKAQEGREIALKVGNILQIELPGSSGTGYSWVAEETFAPYLKLMDQATRQLKAGLGRADPPGGKPWQGSGH